MDYNFIVIEGNIGAGKTTLSHKISEDRNAKLILEQFAENPFLPKFYKDPEKYSFPLEMSFLADRYNQLKKELSERDLFKSFTISDYYFMKSLIFSKQTLQDDEYTLYRQFFHIIYNSLPKPDLYVYLHSNVDKLLSNIKKRGRDYEQEITAEYLLKIQDSYFEFFKQQRDLKFLVIDTNNIDFVNQESDYEKITEAIFHTECKAGLNRIIL
ncbi:deoxynucleoside kinase [Marinifilum caeruleilacunae]|jgi:deoxyadenosine/deoxycytidine kinase|uniref:Deoxynucleoside kinase n=1 Tax=Marinifilum caeruleilacunae TaxID=2499076 RepID=A0ABX1X185_9BACT|nr:deoxynucleoside kinase [Marinifilum caeruleilacunae]NOU61849.1 deoxynucleoside kinase [Marinifilum caeruleilacunae]